MLKPTIVTSDNVEQVLGALKAHGGPYGFDTETYGVGYGHDAFSLAIHSVSDTFYFNFYGGEDHLGNRSPVCLDPAKVPMQPLFSKGLWFAHNLKFDLMKVERLFNVQFTAKVWCTMVAERLLRNDKLDYSLDATSKKYGYAKDKRVDEYIKKHSLYKKDVFMGAAQARVPMFYMVPFELLSEYAGLDAQLALQIGMKQNEELRESFHQ